MFEPTLRNWSGHAVWTAVFAGLSGLVAGDFEEFVSSFVFVFVLLMLFPTFACFGPARVRAWLNEMFS